MDKPTATVPSDSNIQPPNVPPFLTETSPPIIAPPPLPARGSAQQQFLSVSLGLYLAVFLIEGIVSVVDSSLLLFFKIPYLAPLHGSIALLSFLMSLAVYALMAIMPAIPKRLFLPLVLFNPVALLLIIPILIYRYDQLVLVSWLGSLGQLFLGVIIWRALQDGFHFRLPLVPSSRLKSRGFQWRHLASFLALNIFVLLPATLIYLFICAATAVDHFSEGFLALRSSGFSVQARKYVRDDGKTVQLFPMAHVADPSFYRTLSAAITSNSIILMEGVTDKSCLITNQISYEKMAAALGVVEQDKEFNPVQGTIVPADVDVQVFTPETIGFLNLIMGIHTKGLDAHALRQLFLKPPKPGFEKQLFHDLLSKRNLHLVAELEARLSEAEFFVVPWGAAHMPEIAREIEKLGFQLKETQDFTALHFRSRPNAPQQPSDDNKATKQSEQPGEEHPEVTPR